MTVAVADWWLSWLQAESAYALRDDSDLDANPYSWAIYWIILQEAESGP